MYNSKKPLKHARSPHLQRGPGVRMSETYDHAGIGGPAVEIHFQLPVLDTETFGRWWPEAEAWPTVERLTGEIIERIDALIVELTAERERLAVELDRVRAANGNGRAQEQRR